MVEKIKIGISSCLLGDKVRYDGNHRLDRFVTDTLGQYFEFIPVCPEIEFGLSIPREPMHLFGSPESPLLVTVKTGIDYTERMLKWGERKLYELEKENLCGFIFKCGSPSSGIRGVKVYMSSGTVTKTGKGLFGGAFIKYFPLIPVEDDGRLHNPRFRENFIERIFVLKRWQEFKKKDFSMKDLIGFHSDHKLLIMAHSPRHYSILGRLLANAKKEKREDLLSEYIRILMEGITLIATVKKNTNVLQHIQGYFKKHLTSDEKQELLGVIESYRKELVPLVVPITLLKHYVRKFNVSYLKRQYYLEPHPIELMLRNHV
ncbi:MAG: DUF1722 domain-containing protein [Candidatus Scalindua sp. AMX11]|nr:MAG: DUF1722 domain-containing protein [Candidatus Scalindua sp.]NOG84921.1 DUF1722 domain-containing protein [Planctomycetota bacterium]RZV84984.1 MAG: DUF1722 domain-containing protein [Candidatus Scalindua sp. SCAELEC01]TDE65022.1 MAG: DUF1722 domain-containing protein [Candidatus Scalindua sp. AMX11]GJQ59413.1 MAG: hypothetical protein SCALA701_22140 [Candidatus Scalindua sp.]